MIAVMRARTSEHAAAQPCDFRILQGLALSGDLIRKLLARPGRLCRIGEQSPRTIATAAAHHPSQRRDCSRLAAQLPADVPNNF